MQQVRYLGFIIDKDGIQPDLENVKAVKTMPRPKDIPILRSFLKLASDYGIFRSDLYRLRAPLNHLPEKNAKWDWSTNRQTDFEKIKHLLASNFLLKHFGQSLPMVVASYASNYGIVAVTSHIFPNGSERRSLMQPDH